MNLVAYLLIWIALILLCFGFGIVLLLSTFSSSIVLGLFATPLALISLGLGLYILVTPIDYSIKLADHEQVCIGEDCTDDIHSRYRSSHPVETTPIIIPMHSMMIK